MKIIRIDNFAREHVADVLIAENVSQYHGRRIVDLLNKTEDKIFNGNSEDYYKLVDNDYKLWRGMEELV